MEDVALIRFIDADIRLEMLASVRAGPGLVELRLVVPDEGEVEVVMTPLDCRRLVDALGLAIRQSRPLPPAAPVKSQA